MSHDKDDADDTLNPNDFRVHPDTNIDLAHRTPDRPDNLDKAEAKAMTAKLVEEFVELQNQLYAEHHHRVLVVLQATDTGGKDGTIRNIFGPLNPQGVNVASFKVPTEPELAHDYLWRVHSHVPGNGEIVVFNRSHYEDVLVVRVHNFVPEDRWKRRYDHIVNFEQMLVDEGTTILKFFLHISKDEQAERLQARLDDPSKHWKFATGDLAEREKWDDYQKAYAAMLSKTSTDAAPWYIVPANSKWYRDFVVASVMVDALRGLKLEYPAGEDLSHVVIDD